MRPHDRVAPVTGGAGGIGRATTQARVLKVVFAVLVGAAVCAGAALVWGAVRWGGETRALTERLDAARTPPTPARYDARELDGLPAPVQRYFRTALTDGQPVILGVRMVQAGMFNVGEDAQAWRPFTATQRVGTRRPGFVWDARVEVMPATTVNVHDAYVAGEGLLQAAIFGLVDVASVRGTPAAARAEFMRFFAECVWYPTALLPSQGVRWEAVDDRSARATLADGGVELALLFRFDERGLVESVRADARERSVGGELVATPWEARVWDYETRDGMKVPMQGEVAWRPGGVAKPYWRGRITRLEYEFAR